MTKNIPYVKQFNDLGECTNPITKNNPYLHQFPSEFTKKQERKYIIVYHSSLGWNKILKSKYFNDVRFYTIQKNPLKGE